MTAPVWTVSCWYQLKGLKWSSWWQTWFMELLNLASLWKLKLSYSRLKTIGSWKTRRWKCKNEKEKLILSSSRPFYLCAPVSSKQCRPEYHFHIYMSNIRGVGESHTACGYLIENLTNFRSINTNWFCKPKPDSALTQYEFDEIRKMIENDEVGQCCAAAWQLCELSNIF